MFRKKQVEEITVYTSELVIGDCVINDGIYVEILDIKEKNFDELQFTLRAVTPIPDAGRRFFETFNRNLKVTTWR